MSIHAVLPLIESPEVAAQKSVAVPDGVVIKNSICAAAGESEAIQILHVLNTNALEVRPPTHMTLQFKDGFLLHCLPACPHLVFKILIDH